MKTKNSFLLTCAISSALACNASLAQSEAQSEGPRTLENIIVTAQKREQNLQDVPIVVTAIPAELLRDTGVRDIKDLTILTPGLVVTSTQNESITTARIRGIGTVGDNPGLESSVGVVIDGVYRPRNGVSFGDLGELERIEVLKGPQGTLFGKNTSAGVINVITKRPETEFGAEIDLSVGNYDAREASASVTGPIVGETLTARLYAAHRERGGLYDVATGIGPRTEDEDMDRDMQTVRGQLQFEMNDSLTARLIADYTQRDENCCVATQIVNGATAAVINALSPGGISIPADPFDRDAFANRPTDQEVEDMGLSVEVEWNLGQAATMTSITAWRNWDTLNGLDADFTAADLLYRQPDSIFGNEFEQFSQELRLAGETERLSWLVGVFYANEDLDSGQDLRYGMHFETYASVLAASLSGQPISVPVLTGRPAGTSYPAGGGQFDTYKQQSDSWALFTNNTYRITDQFEATFGLRYTKEEKDLRSHYTNIGGGSAGCAALRARRPFFAGVPAATLDNLFALGCAPFADPLFDDVTTAQGIDEEEWSGTAKLAYRFTDKVMTYVSYARGYKAGGFNLDRERLGPPTNPTRDDLTDFAPEMVDSYELGTKTSWGGNTLLFNASLFYQDFEDFQLNAFNGINFEVVSIPEVISQGFDLDLLWFVSANWSLQGGITYADTEIGDDYMPTSAAFALLPGNQLSFAPEWSTSASVTYEQPVGSNLELRGNLGAKWMSDYNTGSDLNPLKEQDAFAVVNARIGLGDEDDRWTVEAWAQNLFDEEFYQVAFDAVAQPGTIAAFLGAPRTYGLTVRFSF